MRAATTRRALRAAAVFLVIAAPRGAVAGDVALAESLFQQGLELMDKGDYATACPKLQESLAQDPATGTLLALALCHEQAGRTASAWAAYTDVISRAKQDGRPDREQAAREKIQALEPRLSRLTIEVDATAAAVPGLVVTRDGVPIGQGAWGAPSPVDPGQHVVQTTAPGKRPWQATVMIGAAADMQVLRVPPLEDVPAPPAVASEAPSSVRSSSVAPAVDVGAPSGGTPLRTIGLVVGGAGVVGLGVSAYFGVRAMDLHGDSNDAGCRPDDHCPPNALTIRNRAVDAANAATVSLVVGGVLTAAGVTLFIVGGSSGASVGATPALGPGTAGLLVHGHL